MDVLHLYKDYAPVRGGIENHVRALAEAQAAAGLDVAVCVCTPADGSAPAGVTRENGVAVHRLPRVATLRSMPLSLPFWRAARRLVAEARVVHVHSPFPLGEAAVRTLPRGVRLVVTHHSDVVRQRLLLKVYAPLYRTFLERVDAILPTSDAYARTSPWLRPHLAKCHTVPLGVDTNRFHPRWQKASVGYPCHPCENSHAEADGAAASVSSVPSVSDSGSAASEYRLLFVGRLRYYKGLNTLLQAMRELPTRIRLDIVGDGPMAAPWRALAAAPELAGRVRFLGELPDESLPDAYRDADLFVLPCNCRAEAFGTVLAEALASGLPCVTCDVGSGTSWVVRDGVTGHVVAPSDSAALAAAILDIADATPERREALSRAARHDAETRLSETAMVAGVLDAYRLT